MQSNLNHDTQTLRIYLAVFPNIPFSSNHRFLKVGWLPTNGKTIILEKAMIS